VLLEAPWRRGCSGGSLRENIGRSGGFASLQTGFYEVERVAYENAGGAGEVAGPEVGGHFRGGGTWRGIGRGLLPCGLLLWWGRHLGVSVSEGQRKW